LVDYAGVECNARHSPVREEAGGDWGRERQFQVWPAGQRMSMVRAAPIERRWEEDLMGGTRLSVARDRRGGLGRLTLMDRWEE
jgi:hypothetical protein